MLLYAVSRFIIEFYRGDPRGMVLGFSTSQFISLVLGTAQPRDAGLSVADHAAGARGGACAAAGSPHREP